MPHHKPYRIWATDIDEDALDKAKEGVYSEDFICSVPPLYLEKYFQPLGEGKYAVVPRLKRRIVFEKHDLLQDEVKETFALVVDVYKRQVMLFLKCNCPPIKVFPPESVSDSVASALRNACLL